MEKEIHEYFTAIDWAVVGGYLILTTWVGHLMKGKQSSIRDFFLGGRSLPWPAVSGSIIATEISGVTFIGVPGMLFAINGDFTYLQWAIGSILARIIVGMVFVRVYYEREIYSPYDYMGRRLGPSAKTLATVIFTVGSILAQSVRVLVAALPLRVVTDMPMWACILTIGVFAIGWTLMGGMRTVIWTDVMQFVLFAFGGVFAFVWILSSINGGFSEMWATAAEFGRTRFLDVTLQADLQFTLWVALIAVPFQNLGVFGTDQLMAQRMFCCKDAPSASKAIIVSSVGQALTLLMMLVGAALFVHYHNNPFTDAEVQVLFDVPAEGVAEARENAQLVSNPNDADKVSNVLKPAEQDNVFPVWIVTILPVGLKGLILAGIFAAAISSLDSILAALSQTTLSLFYHPEKGKHSLTDADLLWKSRMLVVMWGIILTLFTFLLYIVRDGIPIIPLAFGMTSYTVGPMLAIFVAAMLGQGSVRGLLLGFVISFVLVMFVRLDIWVLLIKAELVTEEWLGSLPTYDLVEGGGLKARIAYVWMWPLTAILTLACGLAIPGDRDGLDEDDDDDGVGQSGAEDPVELEG